MNTGRLHLYAYNTGSKRAPEALAGAHTLVRYELILHRAPKLRASDIESRMGDLPEEFSAGSLQRALEDPENGPIPIAWGDNRKRLHLIQRRIAILNGEAVLVDRAGPFRQRLTEWGDTIFGPFRRDEAAAANSGKGGFALAQIAWALAVLVAASGVVLWRYGDKLPLPPWVRPGALQLAGFVAGVTLAQMLASGVRMWLQGPGRRILAAGCVLISLSCLCAASYQARELGLWKRADALKARLTHEKQHKPNMKPFTALMVELERRHQRRELTAALERSTPKAAHGENATNPADSAKTAPGAAGPEAMAANTAESKGAGVEAATPASAQRQVTEPAMPQPMQPQATLLAATTSQRPQPSAAPRVAADATPGAASPRSSAKELARETSERSARSTLAQGGIAGVTARAAAITDRTNAVGVNGRATPVILQQDHPSGPWRTVGDVNPIHGALAALAALLTFGLGVWVGRRGHKHADAARTKSSLRPTAADLSGTTAAASAEDSREREAASRQDDARSPARARSMSPQGVARQAEAAKRDPSGAAPLPQLEAAQLGHAAPPSAANDPSAAIAAASAQRLSAEAPRGGRRGAAAGGAGFSVQEARVSPRKRDTRSDD